MARLCAIFVVLFGMLVIPPTASAIERGDEPSTAFRVTLGTAQYNSSAMTANASVDPAACGEFEGFSNTMWFSYTPSRRALTIVDVSSFVSPDGSTDFLAIAFVFAKHGSSLDLVGCSAYPATVFFTAAAGTTYLIMVGGLGADDTGEPELSDRGGTFDLTIMTIRGRVITDRFHDTGSFVDEELSAVCGFEVTVSFDNRGTSKTFFSTSGTRMFTFFIVGSTTFSTEDGRKLTFSYAQPFQDRLDGNVAILGLPIKVRLDGKLVTLDAGRLVIGPDGSIVFEAGKHPTFDEGVDVCGLLAS
jgi:hypothetical protein